MVKLLKPTTPQELAMLSFLQRFSSLVTGVLSGFDRLRFRGSKCLLNTTGGMLNFLWHKRILLKDFKAYVCDTTDRLRRAVERAASDSGRPLIFLNHRERKEDLARKIAARDRISSGLICVVSAVECCHSFSVHPDRASKRLILEGGPKKCLHYYHYYLHPQLGLMHARLQTWFPFTMHVCLNGREWLARQMDRAGVGYVKKDNCFVDVEDLAAAQALMDSQLQTDWPALLGGIASCSNPAESEIFGDFRVPYYWSAEETEWASDVMFSSPEALAGLYPRLLRHGIEVLQSADVLRYLGKKLTAQGGIRGDFKGEVLTDLKGRPEGMRLKHRLGGNWVKMYDKQGSVLRIETVINDVDDLKVYRGKQGDESGEKQWRKLRKGVADLFRRAEVSHKANERYADSLAQAADTKPLREMTEPLCEAVQWHGRRARGLNPLGAADAELLGAVSRGEFLMNGFRNRDVRALLYGATGQGKKGSAAVTRKLRLLRAHGLISKVPSTHRYVLNEKGRAVCAAILAARQADTTTLGQAA
jgi:hypothetical protein